MDLSFGCVRPNLKTSRDLKLKWVFHLLIMPPYSLPTTNICFHCNFTFLYDLGLAFGIDSGHPLLSCCHTHFCCHPFGAGSDAFVELSPGPPQPVQTGRVPFVAAVLNSPKTVCIRWFLVGNGCFCLTCSSITLRSLPGEAPTVPIEIEGFGTQVCVKLQTQWLENTRDIDWSCVS